MAINCDKIRESLEEVKRMSERFSVLLDDARVSRDYERLEPLKNQLKEKLVMLAKILDKHEIPLRVRIGKKYKAEYVGEFIDDRARVVIRTEKLRKRKRKTEILVDREGNTVLGGEFDLFKDAEVVIFQQKGGLVIVTEASTRTYLFTKEGENLFPEETEGLNLVDYSEFCDVFVIKKKKEDLTKIYRWENGLLSEMSGVREDVRMASEVSDDIGKSVLSHNLYDKSGRLLFQPLIGSVKDFLVAKKGPIAVKKNDESYIFFDRAENPISNEFLVNVDGVYSAKKFLFIRKKDKNFLIDDKGGNLFEGGDFESGVDEISPFYDGMAKVKKGKKYFYIDETGKNILHGHLKHGVMIDSTNFNNGRAVARLAGTWAVIDRKGKVIKTFKTDCEVLHIEGGFIHIKRGSKCFLLTLNGEDFMKDGDFADGVDEVGRILFRRTIVVKKGDRWFLMDRRGKNVFANTEFKDGLEEKIYNKEGVFYAGEESEGARIYFNKYGRRIFNYK